MVHVSIVNADVASPLSYYRLLNNIAWTVRRFSVVLLPGRGDYRVQTVFVGDFARMVVAVADGDVVTELDVVGPEVFGYRDLVCRVRAATGAKCAMWPAPRRVAWLAAAALGLVWRENLLPGIELVNGDCVAVLPGLPPADLILISPPYDNLREFGGYNDAFDFDAIAAACVGNLAPGGVLVWIGGDQIIDGGETGTYFRQALGFMGLGLTLLRTMIFELNKSRHEVHSGYNKSFTYMFVLSNGKPKTTYPLADRPNKSAGMYRPNDHNLGRTLDQEVGRRTGRSFVVSDYDMQTDIWRYRGGGHTDPDFKGAHTHPAIFPLCLARDHTLSRTDRSGLVIDRFG